MHIQRIGFTPIKGGRHVEHGSVVLAPGGPVGDRLFSLVDLERRRVLRTVENPALLAGTARWESGLLSIALDGETLTAAPGPTGDRLELDYWGRPAAVEVVSGPWAAAYSRYLGREVVLTRAMRASELVYGASVTIVTTGALRLLSERAGHEIDAARFRATFVLDTDDLEPHAEDSWAGRELQMGAARLRILKAVDRCAVIDFEPATGASGTRLLQTLATYRLRDAAIDFGMYAEVVTPANVVRGDPVMLLLT